MRGDLPEHMGDLDLAHHRRGGGLKHGPHVIGTGTRQEVPRRHATAQQSEGKVGYLASPLEGQVVPRSAVPLPSA